MLETNTASSAGRRTGDALVTAAGNPAVFLGRDLLLEWKDRRLKPNTGVNAESADLHGAFPIRLQLGASKGWIRLCCSLDHLRSKERLLGVRAVMRVVPAGGATGRLTLQLAKTLSGSGLRRGVAGTDQTLDMSTGVWREIRGVFACAAKEEEFALDLLITVPDDSSVEFAALDTSWFEADLSPSMRADLESHFVTPILPFGTDKAELAAPFPPRPPIFLNRATVGNGALTGAVLSETVGQIIVEDETGRRTCAPADRPVRLEAGIAARCGFMVPLDELLSSSTRPQRLTVRVGDSADATDIMELTVDTSVLEGQSPQMSVRRKWTRLIIADYVEHQCLVRKCPPPDDCEAFRGSCTDLSIRPNPLFDPRHVANALGMTDGTTTIADILRTYVEDPKAWRLATSPLFLSERLDVWDAPVLLAYMDDETLWSCSPHPLFDVDHFLAQEPDDTPYRWPPLIRYLLLDRATSVNPHPLFQTAYYALQFDAVWKKKIHPLEHFVLNDIGDPSPHMRRHDFLSAHPDHICARPLWQKMLESYSANPSHRYDTEPPIQSDKPFPRIIIQMTPKTPRNPYYRQFEQIFAKPICDFRYAQNLDEMIKYSQIRKNLLFIFHQLEPFYHSYSYSETRLKMNRLLDCLTQLHESGAKLVHVWHNKLPYDKSFIDLDFELFQRIGDVLDLIITHYDGAIPWIRKFCPATPVVTLPHPAVTRRMQTNIDTRVARQILRLPENAFVLSTFGEIRRYKNIRLIIDAWKEFRAHEDANDSILIIAGKWRYTDGDFEEANSVDNIVMIDEVLSEHSLSTVLASSDISVFSHSEVWMSGAAITAMGFGKPLIVPSHTGLSSLIHEAQNGFIFDNPNTSALSSAIRSAKACDRLEHMSFMSRAFIGERTSGRLAPLYMNALRQVL